MKHSGAFFRVALWTTLTSICATALVATGIFLYLAPSLPSVEDLRNVQLQTPLRVYSQDRQLIAEFGEKKRNPIRYEDIPPLYLDALLATEDKDFERHFGVDIKGLARAAFELITTGRKKSGGGTITMQVARNFYLSREKTFSRKFTEILLALQIEQELTKKQILELYVNKIYFGKRAYGIEAAAQTYYGKPIQELNLAQLAMIAGLPQAPSANNPINNPDKALERRNHVLARMHEEDKIDEITYQDAKAEPLSASFHGVKPGVYSPYVAEMVRQEMLERFGEDAYTGGYNVITSIDPELQQHANQAVQRGLLAYSQRQGYRPSGQGYELIYVPVAERLDNLVAPEPPSQNGPAAASEVGAEPSKLDIPANLEYLSQHADQGLLKAGLVINSDQEKSLQVLLRDASQVSLDWPALRWARPYVSVNRRGPRPKVAADIASPGELVYVYQNKKVLWQLGQIPQAQSAFVALDPANGAVRALVGGFDFKQSNFNRVTQAARQAGSNFKPFMYTAALHYGYTPASIINDAPVVFKDDKLESTWRPENYSGKFFGPTRLRQALYKSRNLVSIRLLKSMGIGRAIGYVSKFGFERQKLPADLSLALGSASFTPMEVVRGYATFANGGYLIEPFFIRHIEDAQGNPLYQHAPASVCPDCEDKLQELNQRRASLNRQISALDALEAEVLAEEQGLQADPAGQTANTPANDGLQASTPGSANESGALTAIELFGFPLAPRVLDPRDVYIMNSMLQDVVKQGTATRALALGRSDLAGKTGTTNDQVDAWFSGFNGDLVATVWVGFDQPSTLGSSAYGSTTALPIWVDFMEDALRGKPNHRMPQPSGLVSLRIDAKTGAPAQAGQKDAIFEIFKKENAPKLEAANTRSNAPLVETDSGEEVLPEQIF